MPNIRTFQRSFGGGEVTPEFFGRIDDIKYQTGLALCRNFIVLPHGPIANRPGFAFVRAVKDSTKKTRLIPFTYSTDQTMVIELGAGYFRFHTQGATLLNGGAPYEVANPYAEADLPDIHYVQSADVLTLVHPNHAPRELRRLGATNWQLAAISFASSLAAPGGLSGSATGGTGTTYRYKVTAVGEYAIDESPASSAVEISGDLLEPDAYNTINWGAVTGAKRYNVYKQSNGLYGYIGQTDGLAFNDDNIAADISRTPPEGTNPFSGAGNYPGAVTYYEQRRCFAGTKNAPQNLWMTRSGTESNMTYSMPSRDDDAISFRVAAREANTIRHLVPLGALVLLTASAEWRAGGADAIMPSTVSVRPQSYVGASNMQPVIVNTNLLYGAARGGHARELAYNWQAGGYITGDLSLRAPHLFDGLELADVAFQKAPTPIGWFVSSSGKLLGLTYVPEQQIGAWHQHVTDGTFESVCCVSEGTEDAVYVVVRRVINGQAVRYVERMAPRLFGEQENAFFVDCGLTYQGAPADEISGLSHLEGCTVSILADGAVHPQRVVTGGQIVLEHEASIVHVGLPFEADAQTLPLAFETAGFGQGRQKNVNKVWLRVYRSSGIFAGPSFDSLTETKQRTTEPYGTPPALKSEEIAIMVTPSWGDGGQLCIRQHDPLPLTIVSMSMEVSIGG
ncbi:hypothetical protein [Pseudothauera rhizosphaerae]|uniref:Uncharacterized protein n=1 Tax=Pseudothauera rhizosphaerae TaxID=2565932 RepID=A0A4S4AWA0_9RHOO|nr:hypothetical protein [Pseudothauera rhizosphaerae]THF64314.1 hypothetical protein E6O51_03110 [Pseudothauera rhizosphaerae]